MRAAAMYRLGVVLCLLSMAGCDRIGTSPPSGIPPETSYHVDEFAPNYDGSSQTIRGASVTSAFFPAAKVQPLLGRLFIAEEYQPGGGHVVVICKRFWQRRLKGDPSSIGKTLQLNGQDFTVVGIMASTFEVPPGVDLWVPKAELSH